MPISSSDIQFRLSGGAGNSNVNASLGGAISSTAITDNTLNNLWDNVSGDESSAGDTEYRCIYVRNGHATLTLFSASIWITSNTASTSDTIELGLGSSAINGTEQTVADESTAPSSVSFSTPAAKGSMSIGDLTAGQHKAVWIKRIVSSSAAAYDSNTYTIKVEGDTGA